MRHILNNSLNFVRGLLSQECVLCGAATREPFCPPCLADLPHHAAPACPICALPTGTGEVCGHCLKTPPAFDRTIAALDYAFPVDALIHALKYGGHLALIEALTQPLIARLATQPRPDLLMPVPLHPARLRARGFNQSLELARPIARAQALPLDSSACRRTRDTRPQAELKGEERNRNLRGAFICDKALTGLHVAVLDDVMTTGATLHEISCVLRERGAAAISVWVIARTLEHTCLT